MTKSQHTPGPWIVDGNVIRGDKQSNGSVSVACVLDVSYPFGRWSGESTQANARLIAAAPDLLAVVQELEESAVYWSEYEVPIGIVERIRAAIKKATVEP